MKAIKYILPFALCLVAFGCTKSVDRSGISPEKPVTDESSARLYSVNLNLQDFKIEYLSGRKSAKEMAAKDYLKFLFYEVFDSSGNFLKRVDQNIYVDSTSFGKLSDSLQVGKYEVVIVGTNDTNYIDHSYLDHVQFAWFSQDIFYKKLPLTIEAHDTSINNVRIDRITGNLEVKLKDASMPENVRYVTVFVDSIVSYFNLLDGSFTGHSSDILKTIIPGITSFNTDFFILGSDNKMGVTIRAYDQDDQVVLEKVVENVQVFSNKKTVLSGYLFGAQSGGSIGIPITVDPDFAETINQTF